MVSLSVSNSPMTGSGPRPVNLKTDLGPLADLIEIAFADTMDSGGRAAIREMRALSRLGPGLGAVPGMNELMLGVGMGYVWIEDGRLIGNVSIYPASLPAETGRSWIIANVAVHPEFRGRGIARQLMDESLLAIRRRRDAGHVILQVESQNWKARRLYETLDFADEGIFTHWRRSPARPPAPLDDPRPYITRRSWDEWRAELALAQQVRPAESGGIGWLRPVVPSLFRPSLRKRLNDLINLRSSERLVIHSQSQREVRSALWIERGFGASTIQLTLLVGPEAGGLDDTALLLTALRRFGEDHALSIEHPNDDRVVNTLLDRFGFRRVRTLVHMRYRP